MEILDQNYITQLVTRTSQGSSNAFAELFSATSSRLYTYADYLLKDKQLSEKVLEKAYLLAVHYLLMAGSGPRSQQLGYGLFLPWMCRTISHLAREEKKESDSLTEEKRLLIEELPLSEGQVLLMTADQQLSLKQTGDFLNFSNLLTHRLARNGKRRLSRNHTPLEEPQNRKLPPPLREEKLDTVTSARMMENILDQCEWEPNTVPMEALASYAVYRKERFTLQRTILIMLLVMFLLLPFLFINPVFEVSMVPEGLRGLPVYTVDVKSLLPVEKVTVRLKNHTLPVYESTARSYSVEPTRNGNLTIRVELFNRQAVEQEYQVEDVDHQGPKLLDYEVRDDQVFLKVTDDGIGVDFAEIYGMTGAGEMFYPLSVDKDSETVCFAYPNGNCDVYIPDHIGNTLHLSLTLE